MPYGFNDDKSKFPIVIDSAINYASENPVQNKVIYQELRKKKNVGFTQEEEKFTTASTIQGIFAAIFGGDNRYMQYMRLHNGTQIRLQPNYSWNENGMRRTVNYYYMECMAEGEDQYSVQDGDYYTLGAIYSTVVFRGALLGKSIELAYRYLWGVFAGQESDYPADEILYFKDNAGNDLSADKRFVGDSWCNVVTYW